MGLGVSVVYTSRIMNTRILIWSLFLLSLLGGAALAQPPDLGYPPPPGWEYVRNLDSLSFNLYAHNDSLFTSSKSVELNAPDIFEHSTDGGKTWHPSNSSKPGVLPVYPLNIKGTPILWNELVGKDSTHTLVVSMDLGQSWQDRAIMNDFIPDLKNKGLTNYGSSEDKNIIADIHSPRLNWFIKYAELPYRKYQNMHFSTDGGITWKLLEIPPPSNYLSASTVTFDIRFDCRDLGAWYFKSQGIIIPHFGENDTATEYYVSRDQGKTFTPIPVLGDLIGVTGKAEHFFWTGPKENYFTGYKTIDSLQQEKNVGLLKKMMPYKFSMDTTNCSIDRYGSIFFPSNPEQVLVLVSESRIDKIKDTVYYDSTWLYYTTDQITYQLLWQRDGKGYAGRTFLDIPKGNVYLVSIDTPRIKYYDNNSIYRKSLWKRKVFSIPSSAVNEQPQSEKADPVISVRWSLGQPVLAFEQPKGSQTKIILFDLLGRNLKEVFSGYLQSGSFTFRVTEGIESLPQVLFVRIEQPSYTHTEKIVIVH